MLDFLSVNNNFNVGFEKEEGFASRGDLKYVFLKRPSKFNGICFSVALLNHGQKVINKIWFSTFLGIGGVSFAHGIDDQDKFFIKQFVFGGGTYLSGYTKDYFKLPPQTILEILYFDIPKEKLSNLGALEFCYGCECVKKISFTASWENGEIKEMQKKDTDSFLNFLKHKNRKTFWKDCVSIKNKVFKGTKRFFTNVINYFSYK